METHKIELKKFKNSKSTLFTGRPQGEEVRESLKLDELDSSDILIELIIPENTTGFNPSFYLGLLYPSYKKLGKENFKKKYSFIIEGENTILRSLLEKDLLDGERSAENSIKSSSIFGSFFK